MGYTLEAIIAPSSLLSRPPTWIADSKIVDLGAGLRMIPRTDALYDALQRGQAAPSSHPFPRFTYLSASLAEVLLDLSEQDTVAYVEADYFGGIGKQRAVAWRNRNLVFPPCEDTNAINQALRLLGVVSQGDKDEFHTIGLGRWSRKEDWLNRP